MGIEKKREINKELFIIPVNTKKIGFENEDTKYQEARMIIFSRGMWNELCLDTSIFVVWI